LGYLTFLLERRLKSVDFVHKLRKMARWDGLAFSTAWGENLGKLFRF
jgi:hypothetical protein